eukprot:5308980-Amphidinium_carterae.1
MVVRIRIVYCSARDIAVFEVNNGGRIAMTTFTKPLIKCPWRASLRTLLGDVEPPPPMLSHQQHSLTGEHSGGAWRHWGWKACQRSSAAIASRVMLMQ